MLDFLNRPASVRFRQPAPRVEKRTTLILDGRAHGVVVAENRRTRRLTLRLLTRPVPREGAPDDQFRITVPPGTGLAEIDAFLARNRDWAGEQLSRRPARVAVRDGAVIPVRGVDTVVVHAGSRRGIARFGDLPDGRPALFVPGEADHLARRVRDVLKREARRDLERAVARYAALLEVHPRSITIRDTVSRWGSCSTTGALNFSWRIVLAPPRVLEYLAAHEVAHLREMNHSPRFWAHVEAVMPDMDEPRRWLRLHGATLHAVG